MTRRQLDFDHTRDITKPEHLVDCVEKAYRDIRNDERIERMYRERLKAQNRGTFKVRPFIT